MKRRLKVETTKGEIEPTLTISPEKVCFIIIKAKEFDAKDEVTEDDPGSNPSDDMGARPFSKTMETTLSLRSLRLL